MLHVPEREGLHHAFGSSDSNEDKMVFENGEVFCKIFVLRASVKAPAIKQPMSMSPLWRNDAKLGD